ncbi:MAG TPA: copper chaperone PCu(A)C [Candidimonas sp.]|nr:copper chaperone PCu(A)C [Candidimonas sp.]
MKLILRAMGAAVLAAMAVSTAHAQVAIEDPWVRATVAQQQATGAFMRLTAEKDARLVRAESDAANIVEIHEMAVQDDVMKMRQVSGIALPSGRAVELKPGGYHIMLIELRRQVKEGDVVPMTLVFEDATGKQESLRIDAPVKPLTTAPTAHGHQGQMKH